MADTKKYVSHDNLVEYTDLVKERIDSSLEDAKSYTDSLMGDKSNSDHIHDDRYYTETEMDAKLDAKSDSTHMHKITDINKLQETLDELIENKTQVKFIIHEDDD